jgi:ribosomal protein S18 acetylase RimI-like enzyme
VAKLEREDDRLTNIDAFSVHPDCFRRGVSIRLMLHVVELADDRMLSASTGAANVPAVALYENYGFCIVKQ